MLSNIPGVTESSPFTAEIPPTKPVSGTASCPEGTGREMREVWDGSTGLV